MKFLTIFFAILLLYSVKNEQDELNQIFKESSYKAMHVLTSQKDTELDDQHRELGKFTVADNNGQHFLRIEFSDILRMPEIHFEGRTELGDSGTEMDNLKIANKELENLIVSNPYYKHHFPLMSVEEMNSKALEFFQTQFQSLQNAKGEKVNLICQTRKIRTNYFHSVCVDEAADNKQMIEFIASLRHAKYCHMILRTKLQDFSLLLPLYVPAEEFQNKLTSIYAQIEESKIHDEIGLEDVWFQLEDIAKQIDPDCVLIGEQDEQAPNMIFGEVINVAYADEYFSDEDDENYDQSNVDQEKNKKKIKKVKKIRKLKSQKNLNYTVKKNNFLEDFNKKDRQYFNKIRRKRKLTDSKDKQNNQVQDGECDFEGTEIQVNYYNLKLFNYVHLRFASDDQHTAGHIISKTNSKEAKEKIYIEFEQFVQDLTKIQNIHEKVMQSEKDPNQEDEVYDISDFENLIFQQFQNAQIIETSHGKIYKQNTNDLIEIKKRGEEFKITFYAPHHQQQDHQKVYMVQNISSLKDNEHMQFFEKELDNYTDWVKNISK